MNYSMKADGGVEFEVNSLYEALLKVKDKRKARGKRYSLATVLTLSVLAKLGGEDTPEGMAEWVGQRSEQLRAGLGLCRQSMPHAVTYRRVLGQAIDIQQLEHVLGAFFKGCSKGPEQLALDGKSLRGTIQAGATRGLHLLAVYAVDSGVVLNQIKLRKRENEISAAPRALAEVDLHGSVVTGDALFSQRELSEHIVEAGGQYLWKVKDNQATLRADIENMFASQAVPLRAGHASQAASVSTVRKVSGRIETHRLTSSVPPQASADWPYLAQVCQLVRTVRVVRPPHTSQQVSYLMTSLSPQAACPSLLLALSKRHWAIENKLHYCRDVTFHEDRCRLATGHAAHAIAALNNLVLGLLRLRGFRSIASARRRFSARPAEALALVLYALV